MDFAKGRNDWAALTGKWNWQGEYFDRVAYLAQSPQFYKEHGERVDLGAGITIGQ